jgi:hypothetical protein
VVFLIYIKEWKIAIIVATGGLFSKLIPIYLLYKRGYPPGILHPNIKLSAAILIFYFFFLWIQNITIFDVYKMLIAATYKTQSFIEFIPILIGIIPNRAAENFTQLANN